MASSSGINRFNGFAGMHDAGGAKLGSQRTYSDMPQRAM